jgi:DNA-binding NarL/FixJ family response regulator
MIQILSIEDHTTTTDGLKLRFRGDRDDMKISCSSLNMDHALAVDENLFDLILLDLILPGTDPLENIERLKKTFPDKPIVIFTSEERSVWEDQICLAGAKAYLTKHDETDKIKEIIKAVYNGEDFCRKRIEALRKEGITINKFPIIKPHDKAILSLFIEGKTIREIAKRKFMTESAVTKSLSKLRKQFNANTNAGLARILLERKLF